MLRRASGRPQSLVVAHLALRGVIRPSVTSYLVVFREGSESIRYRHLARLVALESHFFENLAAGEAAAFANHTEQVIALIPAPAGAAPSTGRAALFALLTLAFEYVELGEHVVELVQLLLNGPLLVQQLFALIEQRLALASDECLGFSQYRCVHGGPPVSVKELVSALAIFVQQHAVLVGSRTSGRRPLSPS